MCGASLSPGSARGEEAVRRAGQESENERDALQFVKQGRHILNYAFNAELSGMTQSSPWETAPVLRKSIEIDVDYIGTSITNSSAMARMLSGYKHHGHNYICN